jgi:hypothetical protein
MTKDAVIMTPPEKRWPQLLTFLGGCLAGAAAVVTAALVMDDAPDTTPEDSDEDSFESEASTDPEAAELLEEQKL